MDLMVDLSLFEESLLKDPKEEVVSALGSEYKEAVVKNVLDLLKGSTPFQMATSVLPFPCLLFIRY